MDQESEEKNSGPAPICSELDRHNAEIEKRALEAADLHLEGAQDRTRGGTKLLPIRQAIYARIKEVDHILSQNVELSCEATAESKTKGQSDGQRSGRNGPSGGR